MSELNKKLNPFFPSAKNLQSKSDDALSPTKSTNVQDKEDHAKIFIRHNECQPSTTLSVTNILSSPLLPQNPSLPILNPFEKAKNDNPSQSTIDNVFRGKSSPISTPISASSGELGLFGGLTSTSDSQNPSPFAISGNNILPLSNSTVELKSVFGQNSSNSLPASFRTDNSSISTKDFNSIASGISCQFQNETSSLFGGKKPASASVSTSSNVFSFDQIKVSSSNPLRKSDSIFGQLDVLKKSSLPNTQKPSLVFSPKFEKSKDELKQTDASKPAPLALFKQVKDSHCSVITPLESSNKSSSDEIHKEDSKDPVLKTNPNNPQSTEIVKSPSKEATMLIAVDIPVKSFDKSILEHHFSKFGIVKRTLLHKKSGQASIFFKTHEAAAEAKAKGKRLHPCLPQMKLFFGVLHTTKKSKTHKISQTEISTRFQKAEPLIKSTMSESSIVKSESIEMPPKKEFKSKAPSGNLGSIRDLAMLMKSQAKNTYDRYLILDARDKVLRVQQKKEVDISKAHYLLATCPDMCPEKERYSREIQYDVSIYEMTDGEIDNKLVVKKFSRSSADKDEPLPHELRSGPVLRKTIDFLICNIMDKGDDDNIHIEVWFNYLFNRTRAIRNDIMQQHLIDHNAVYVLERCTRFHIHCSHHLCEEPADSFDAKNNAEHLTKSLQSLKDLYHDLSEKEVYFENEAEFRCYEVLLSIMDGNVSFKYQKLRNSVQNSNEVCFAVNVLHSVQTNNYVKFFRLLKKATYLQACIMHKYLDGIRRGSFNAIAKAYKYPQLPIMELVKKLGFSNEEESRPFMAYYGINLNEDFKSVNKQDTPLPFSRSLQILSLKKHISTGQIIHNGPLPENSLSHYQPHDSFDSKGFLKINALDASDQSLKFDALQHHEIEAFVDEKFIKEDIKKDLYSKIDKFYQIKLLRRCYHVWTHFILIRKEKQKMEKTFTNLISQKFVKIWKEKVAKIVALNRKIDKLVLERYFRRWKTFTHSCLNAKNDIKKAKLVEKRIIAQKFLRAWQINTAHIKSVRIAKAVRKHLLACKFFTKWQSYIKALHFDREAEAHYKLKLLRSSFTHWVNWFMIKKKKNKLDLEYFPGEGSQLCSKDLNALLKWGYERDDQMNMTADEISKLDCHINVKSQQHFSLQQVSGIVAWAALPLLHRFQVDIESKPPDFSGNLFTRSFKLLIWRCQGTDPYFIEWVRTKFNLLDADDLSFPLHCHSQFLSHRNEVTYSFTVLEKELCFIDDYDLDGISFVVLIGNEDKLDLMREHINNIKEIPYLIMGKSKDKQYFYQNTWLLMKETVDCPFTSEKLCDFIYDIWQKRAVGRNLQLSNCASLAEKFVTEKVLIPLYHVANQRTLYVKSAVSPCIIVNFYNASISHLRSCIQNFQDKCKFRLPYIPNASCKPMNDAEEIETGFQRALLPPFNIPFESISLSVRVHLKNYLEEVALKEWNGNLLSEVESIIRDTERSLDDTDSRHLYSRIPWVKILICCIFFKLSSLPELQVLYNQSDLNSFDQKKHWLSMLNISEVQTLTKKDKDFLTKRKLPIIEYYSEPKKMRCNQSQLLKDIENEKEKSRILEDEFKSQLLIEEELKFLFASYDEAMYQLNA